MAAVRVSGWRVEARRVGLAGALGGSEGVVDFEDDALGAVFAVGLLVVLPDDGEGVHHEGGVLAVQGVEMEEGGVQFAAEQGAANPKRAPDLVWPDGGVLTREAVSLAIAVWICHAAHAQIVGRTQPEIV